MMKQEFEKLVATQFSSADYKVIEIVYMNYPGVHEKEDIAELYNIGGMNLINDLHDRAKRIEVATKNLNEAKKELDSLTIQKRRG